MGLEELAQLEFDNKSKNLRRIEYDGPRNVTR
jgi:hypothetical protein